VLIDLVEVLRCPRAHEESWLVASAHRAVGRQIVDGVLGCPVCYAEYPIRQGAVWFVEPPEARPTTPSPTDTELAIRIAAFLDLALDAPGVAILAGEWGRVTPLLRAAVSTHLIAMNARRDIIADEGISPIYVRSAIPLADASCRGVALDTSHTGTAVLESAARVLRPRGRLVAPAATPLPTGVTELARDGTLWVGERTAPPPKLVTLQPRLDG
jgi:uncharacterized protein YbaR (Trm112 family)